MNEVFMIGVNHSDPNGDNNLENLLFDLSPDLVFLEGSELSFDSQELYTYTLEDQAQDLGVNPEIIAIAMKEQEAKGFERRAARSYCLNERLSEPIYFDDVVGTSLSETIKLAMASAKNISELDVSCVPSYEHSLQADFAEIVHTYLFFNEAFKNGTDDLVLKVFGEKHLGEKDEIMARKLMKVFHEKSNLKVATVTGMKHMLEHPTQKTFYSKISDMNPQRIVLGYK